MSTLSSSPRLVFTWVSDPFPSFQKTSSWLARIFFKVIGAPTSEIQQYDEWAVGFAQILSAEIDSNELELENCLKTLENIGRSPLRKRLICLFAAYMFAQSRIVFSTWGRGRFQTAIDRVLLQLVVRMCVWSKRPIKGETKWSCVRFMRAAQTVSGRCPVRLDTLYKQLTNTRIEKLSEVFDREIRGKKPSSNDEV